MRAGRWVLILMIMATGCTGGSDPVATGIVMDVEGELEDIEQFAILVEGERMVFEISAEGEYAFPPAHLREHLRSGEPVRVRWREEGNRRIATFLDDG